MHVRLARARHAGEAGGNNCAHLAQPVRSATRRLNQPAVSSAAPPTVRDQEDAADCSASEAWHAYALAYAIAY